MKPNRPAASDPKAVAEEHYRLMLAARQAALHTQLLREAIVEVGERRRREQRLVQRLQEQYLQLEALNAQKDELLGMAAHDLRNPLSVVLGFADVLLADPAVSGNEQLREFGTIIADTARHMVALIDDILAVSQIESGRLTIDREPADLAALVRAACVPNRMLAERKSITLLEHLPAHPVITRIDPLRIRQVLDNLLSNAIKFSYERTTITVRVWVADDRAFIEVADQGQGIRDEDLGKLFRPFTQTATRATAGEKSTGLGLAIVKRIVELHGGTVNVHSRWGQGATFTIALPLVT
ncbi:MAG TPA: HAMP domain-containing sensor histidine kinase [Armatimonadota bacterium]|nr:HAMP domain-containing sensor histidine kinase [Armatimonadota bacterium]